MQAIVSLGKSTNEWDNYIMNTLIETQYLVFSSGKSKRSVVKAYQANKNTVKDWICSLDLIISPTKGSTSYSCLWMDTRQAFRVCSAQTLLRE